MKNLFEDDIHSKHKESHSSDEEDDSQPEPGEATASVQQLD